MNIWIGRLIIVAVILTAFSYAIATFFLTIMSGAPFVATRKKLIREMFDALPLEQGQVVADLGSGAGDFLLVAAKEYNATRVIGYDINPILTHWTRLRFKLHKAPITPEIHTCSFMKADLSDVDVLCLYLLTETMEKIRPIVRTLPEHAIVISHGFQFPGCVPTRTVALPHGNMHVYNMKAFQAE